MLDFKSMSSGFKDVPQEDSDWWMFAKQYILGIDRPSQSLWDVVKLREHIDPSLTEGSADKLETKLKELLGIKNELKIRIQKIVEEKKKITVFQEKIDEDASINKAKRVEFEEYKGKILKEELRLDKEKQKLKKQFEKIQKKKEKKNQKSQFDDMSPEEKLNLLEKIEAEEAELNRLDIRENALMQIMTIMINCTIYQRQANSKLMDRFKERIKSDKELEVKRIEEINKQVDKKLRAMNKKLSKIRRMKQEETAIVLAKDIEKFKKSIAEKCQGIEDDSKRELAKQEKRLKKLFATASDPNLGEAKSAKVFLELIRNIDRQKNFVPDFIKYTSIKIKNEFSDTLIPFYQNMFEILNPDIQEKVMLVQAIEKSGSDKGVKIALTDEEIAEYDGIIEDSKNKLNKVLPKIFENKVICMTESMTLEQLLNLSMDKVSMETIMRLKLIAPGSGKPIKLPVEIIKELFKLNELINPVPKYNLIKEGGHKEKDPQKAIDVLQLGKLLRA